MKKVFLVALMLVGITTFAQDKRMKGEKLTTEQRVEKRTNKLKTDLSLNDKQTAEIKDLMTKNAAKHDAKRADMKATKEKNRAEMKANMAKEQEGMKSEMKRILNADQYAKWQQQNADKKAKMSEKFQERKAKRQELKDK